MHHPLYFGYGSVASNMTNFIVRKAVGLFIAKMSRKGVKCERERLQLKWEAEAIEAKTLEQEKRHLGEKRQIKTW